MADNYRMHLNQTTHSLSQKRIIHVINMDLEFFDILSKTRIFPSTPLILFKFNPKNLDSRGRIPPLLVVSVFQ